MIWAFIQSISVQSALQWAWHSEAFHFLALGGVLRGIASLEAPTKDSGMWYRNFFKISNALAMQWERMNPRVENSPNWEHAIQKAQDLGQIPKG